MPLRVVELTCKRCNRTFRCWEGSDSEILKICRECLHVLEKPVVH
jgi:hypothetical protein